MATVTSRLRAVTSVTRSRKTPHPQTVAHVPGLTRLPIRAVLVAICLAGGSASCEPLAFDLVVYGATASGSIAAIAAAKEGVRVALVEPGQHPGGMVSGGLSRTDMDRQDNVIGGLTRKFFESLGHHYNKPIAWTFEPKVAENQFRERLEQAKVKTYFGSGLAGIAKNGARITRLRTENGIELEAAVFIDSSYEGDLMKAAGVSYAVGREGRSRYGESLAGRQDFLPGSHQFHFPVLSRGSDGQLLQGVIAQEKSGQLGEGDGKFQSYCFRLCLTNVPDNRLPIEPPPGYSASRYQLVKNYLASGKGDLALHDFMGLSPLPNGKADVNSNGPVSTDLLGASWEYPDAGQARRRQIWNEHLHWAQGLVYFLQHDESVPPALRAEALNWGLPKDEFPETGHWPHQLYVREGRRMIGEYVMTQQDLQENRRKYDSIGMGAYNIDIREVQWVAHKVYRFPDASDEVFTEGYISVPVQPYEIPYRALLPRQQECENLLVTSCISASTVAYGSFRMEPQYMIAGHSAGVAAALAVRSRNLVHRIDLRELQRCLREQGQILSLNEVQKVVTK
ncbi:MAG: FAD-dependent oxidoreductase [Bryobacteraceae bacterium]